MKRALVAVLVLAILTPSLACMMAFCPVQSAGTAVEVKTASSDMPKPCHAAPAQRTVPTGPMVVLDCMGVDLFAGGEVQALKAPLLIAVVLPYFPDQTLVSDISAFLPVSRPIRGPPPDLQRSAADLFVRTTRLLI